MFSNNSGLPTYFKHLSRIDFRYPLSNNPPCFSIDNFETNKLNQITTLKLKLDNQQKVFFYDAAIPYSQNAEQRISTLCDAFNAYLNKLSIEKLPRDEIESFLGCMLNTIDEGSFEETIFLFNSFLFYIENSFNGAYKFSSEFLNEVKNTIMNKFVDLDLPRSAIFGYRRYETENNTTLDISYFPVKGTNMITIPNISKEISNEILEICFKLNEIYNFLNTVGYTSKNVKTDILEAYNNEKKELEILYANASKSEQIRPYILSLDTAFRQSINSIFEENILEILTTDQQLFTIQQQPTRLSSNQTLSCPSLLVQSTESMPSYNPNSIHPSYNQELSIRQEEVIPQKQSLQQSSFESLLDQNQVLSFFKSILEEVKSYFLKSSGVTKQTYKEKFDYILQWKLLSSKNSPIIDSKCFNEPAFKKEAKNLIESNTLHTFNADDLEEIANHTIDNFCKRLTFPETTPLSNQNSITSDCNEKLSHPEVVLSNVKNPTSQEASKEELSIRQEELIPQKQSLQQSSFESLLDQNQVLIFFKSILEEVKKYFLKRNGVTKQIYKDKFDLTLKWKLLSSKNSPIIDSKCFNEPAFKKEAKNLIESNTLHTFNADDLEEIANHTIDNFCKRLTFPETTPLSNQNSITSDCNEKISHSEVVLSNGDTIDSQPSKKIPSFKTLTYQVFTQQSEENKIAIINYCKQIVESALHQARNKDWTSIYQKDGLWRIIIENPPKPSCEILSETSKEACRDYMYRAVGFLTTEDFNLRERQFKDISLDPENRGIRKLLWTIKRKEMQNLRNDFEQTLEKSNTYEETRMIPLFICTKNDDRDTTVSIIFYQVLMIHGHIAGILNFSSEQARKSLIDHDINLNVDTSATQEIFKIEKKDLEKLKKADINFKKNKIAPTFMLAYRNQASQIPFSNTERNTNVSLPVERRVSPNDQPKFTPIRPKILPSPLENNNTSSNLSTSSTFSTSPRPSPVIVDGHSNRIENFKKPSQNTSTNRSSHFEKRRRSNSLAFERRVSHNNQPKHNPERQGTIPSTLKNNNTSSNLNNGSTSSTSSTSPGPSLVIVDDHSNRIRNFIESSQNNNAIEENTSTNGSSHSGEKRMPSSSAFEERMSHNNRPKHNPERQRTIPSTLKNNNISSNLNNGSTSSTSSTSQRSGWTRHKIGVDDLLTDIKNKTKGPSPKQDTRPTSSNSTPSLPANSSLLPTNQRKSAGEKRKRDLPTRDLPTIEGIERPSSNQPKNNPNTKRQKTPSPRTSTNNEIRSSKSNKRATSDTSSTPRRFSSVVNGNSNHVENSKESCSENTSEGQKNDPISKTTVKFRRPTFPENERIIDIQGLLKSVL